MYDDPNKTVYTYADKDTFGESGSSGGICSAAKYDGLGRTWRKAAWEGSTWSITETQFDEIGRVKKTSNPFRTANLTDATPGSAEWTTSDYDGVGRVTKVTTPDTAHVDTYYWGNMVRVDDQATKKRISQTNALGQLTSVWEVTPSDGATVNVTFNGTVFAAYQSTYLYNGLSSLAKVTQGAQNRYFMYDSLSRLIRAKNVEQSANASINLSDSVTGNSQWSMAYSYDANGNMLTKVDARNVTTTYGYDNLNRNTSVSYNDGITPGLNRYYDGATNGIGRFQYNVSYNAHPVTGAAAYSFTQVNSYDALGRVTSQTQNFLNTGGTWTPYTSSRTYNLASSVLTQNYPSNRTATYAYNAAAQLTSFTGTLGDGTSRNYATGITYTAAGLMSRETFGMQAATLYHNLHYNNRLQLADIRVGDSSTDEWNWTRGALVYYYGTTARDGWNAFANSADNNGNVLRQVNYAPLSGGGYEIPQLDDYNYDALNRNTSVTEAQQNSAGTWTFNLFTQSFGYDRWGNRTVSCSPCQSGVTGDTFTVDTATNRLTAKNGVGMTYDSAGNQTYDATGNRWFDGENRMYKAVQGGTTSYYVYDADGKRVRRIVGATETWMVYGIDGEMVAEYSANGASGSPQKEYGYRGGQMLIVAQTSPLEIRWTVPDHLGTPRMNIMGNGASGGLLSSVKRHDYLPFGEELFAGVGLRSSSSHGYEPPSDGVRQKFVSYERDNETSLDFVQARYYSSVQGRFTSVDPLNPVIDYDSDKAFYKYIAQPQNWNGYAFDRNNPLKFVDRDGKHPALVGALIGAAIGAGIELAKQVYTLQPGQEVDWGKVAGASVRGAIVGGVAGATGGLSLVPYVFASAGANIVGGVAERATEAATNGALENVDDYALDMDSMVVDGLAGAAGGLAGKFAESQAIRQAGQQYLNSSVYNRAVQTLRNIGGKSDKQVNNATQTIQSGFNNFFWWANQARNKMRSAGTAGTTAAAKKYKPVDCDKPGSGCKTEVRIVE